MGNIKTKSSEDDTRYFIDHMNIIKTTISPNILTNICIISFIPNFESSFFISLQVSMNSTHGNSKIIDRVVASINHGNSSM